MKPKQITTYWVMQGPSGRILIETIAFSADESVAKFGVDSSGTKDPRWNPVKVNIVLECPDINKQNRPLY